MPERDSRQVAIHINTALVLAAGKGTRMRAYTTSLPKPLVEVAGQSLLDRVLDHLAAAEVETVVVNLHHMADMLQDHLESRNPPPNIVLSDERDLLLETGGGAVRARPLLGNNPALVINSDALWLNEGTPPLAAMAKAFDPARMDVLLMLVPTRNIEGYQGHGDYALDPDSQRASRRRGETQAAYLFGGVRIINPSILGNYPEEPFSFLKIFDDAEAQGRLYGYVHNGPWFHVGSKAEVEIASTRIAEMDLVQRGQD